MEMTRQETIDSYKQKGFTVIPHNYSGIGTDVLIKSNTVVRIGSDSGYSAFAKLAQNTTSGLTNVVKIYSHSEPLGPVNDSSPNNEYSITEMELLTPMSQSESGAYEEWILPALDEIRKGKNPASDPYNLSNDLKILLNYSKTHNFDIDLLKSANVMKRGNVFIILDPFG
ncbi:TPA: hypothetical protein ACKR0U_001267 [Proteus mirabilis]|uniref:hypothetical protein n=2 Tax=Proteus mirabilis TaxID=584 RepID=UPI00254DB56E|nr:hypothetical protein [Proteus mirabilis]ELB1230929.1 hypothetical protein [Proteus mirabilis]MDK6198502.1 hypothetical protein [Proteus mirabilis]HEJ9467819.1 hypothetical protein [Proteus mirabilis]HEK0458277.1 hypothetical protein [Proteus mirabilis]HEK0594102.1 hypothetical protein [Proteus mirabilis]